jgi:hypothetical protein
VLLSLLGIIRAPVEPAEAGMKMLFSRKLV